MNERRQSQGDSNGDRQKCDDRTEHGDAYVSTDHGAMMIRASLRNQFITTPKTPCAAPQLFRIPELPYAPMPTEKTSTEVYPRVQKIKKGAVGCTLATFCCHCAGNTAREQLRNKQLDKSKESSQSYNPQLRSLT